MAFFVWIREKSRNHEQALIAILQLACVDTYSGYCISLTTSQVQSTRIGRHSLGPLSVRSTYSSDLRSLTCGRVSIWSGRLTYRVYPPEDSALSLDWHVVEATSLVWDDTLALEAFLQTAESSAESCPSTLVTSCQSELQAPTIYDFEESI